jgi:hypothetical protein
MKNIFAAASVLAMTAGGAMATTSDSFQLTVTVSEYVEITTLANDSSITAADPFGGSSVSGNNNRNNADGDKSVFEVSATVPFEVTLTWDTWTSPLTGSYNHASYDGTDCRIGGTITADTNPAPNSNNTATPPSGASPWVLNSSGALQAASFTPGQDRRFGIGIEASPNVNDCPGGTPPADDYVLDVAVTVAAQ